MNGLQDALTAQAGGRIVRVMQQVMVRIGHQLLWRGFSAWVRLWHRETHKQDRDTLTVQHSTKLLLKVSQRLVHQQLWRAMHAWVTQWHRAVHADVQGAQAGQHGARSLMQVARRMRQQSKWNAWHTWVQMVQSMRRQEMEAAFRES